MDIHFLRQSFPASQKQYETSSRYPDLKIPFKKIQLTNGESFSLYDTAGLYTDPSYSPDPGKGLPSLRSSWSFHEETLESYEGRNIQPKDNGYVDTSKSCRHTAPGLQRTPRRARKDKGVTQLYYARKGDRKSVV